MRIFMAHNYYQSPGGEDRSFAAEASMLEAMGHEVYRYTKHNDAIKNLAKARVAQATIWNQDTYDELSEIFSQQHFDIAHFQNTFPLISPSAYYAAEAANIPVVQSLRNYRLVCPNAIFYRDGHVCEDCLGKAVAWPGILHHCYHDSSLETAGVVALQVVHHLRGTWQHHIDHFITLSNFAREKFIEAGFDPNQISVKPNFLLTDPRVGSDAGYCVYLGRLTEEKGVFTMLEAWQHLSDIPLKILGDGPARGKMAEIIQANQLNVSLLGSKKPEEAIEILRHARLLVFPSEWYETFGRVAIEAFACAVPVIASRIGAINEVVSDNVNGLHFTAGDAVDLGLKLRLLWDNPQQIADLRKGARASYEAHYTPQQNYQDLMGIYEKAIESHAIKHQERSR